MAIVTGREKALEVLEEFRKKRVCMAIFCTASHWNTEAILLAASRFAKKHGLPKIALSVAMTCNYEYMAQAARVNYDGNVREGFISIMEHLKVLCESEEATYSNVVVLPHLDHGDPVRDQWALTEALPYLASVMFDAQKYAEQDNIAMTRDYVRKYGKQVLVEGVMEELSVEGHASAGGKDDYIDRALRYIKETGIDFLVADLGTEQQSTAVGKCTYKRDRARALTESLGKPMLVLHGTSCLTRDQMSSLAEDGILRVNMWTRIAREAGQFAAHRLLERMDEINAGSFEATESRQYLYDSIEKAAEIMEEILGILGYARFAEKEAVLERGEVAAPAYGLAFGE